MGNAKKKPEGKQSERPKPINKQDKSKQTEIPQIIQQPESPEPVSKRPSLGAVTACGAALGSVFTLTGFEIVNGINSTAVDKGKNVITLEGNPTESAPNTGQEFTIKKSEVRDKSGAVIALILGGAAGGIGIGGGEAFWRRRQAEAKLAAAKLATTGREV